MSNKTQQTERRDNPEHLAWRCQVWANYHYGQMLTENAEKLAGPEPARWLEVKVQ